MTNNDKGNHNKSAFVIAPIGQEASRDRRKIDGLIETVIQPILDEFDLKALASHQISKSGSINSQIIEHLLKDGLVICNLTGLNPNVMYELAVRHAVMLPAVLIAEEGTQNPFDIFGERTIPFEDSFKGVAELRPKLKAAIKDALETAKLDNPIARVVGQESIVKEIAAGDPAEYLMSRVDGLEDTMNSILEEIKSGPRTVLGSTIYPSGGLSFSPSGFNASIPAKYLSGTSYVVGSIPSVTIKPKTEGVQAIIKGPEDEIDGFIQKIEELPYLVDGSKHQIEKNQFELKFITDSKNRPNLAATILEFLKKHKKLELLTMSSILTE